MDKQNKFGHQIGPFWAFKQKKEPVQAPKLLILMVGARGFEPPTPCTPCKCATRLRYAPTFEILSIHPLALRFWDVKPGIINNFELYFDV
jgi:hypothetical protein